jgi:hypothetical protein
MNAISVQSCRGSTFSERLRNQSIRSSENDFGSAGIGIILIRLKQQPPADLMADQSVARKTRFEKLDMFSVSPFGPLKIFGSYVAVNTSEVFKNQGDF